MKTILKRFSLPVIAILVVIGLSLNKCNQPKEPIPFDLRAYLMDSIQQADILINIAEIDAVKDSFGTVAATLKAENVELRKALKKQKVKSDTLVKLVPLTDTICWDALNSKQAEIDTLNVICDNLDKEAITYSRQLFLCENQRELESILLETKTKQNEKLNADISVLQKQNKRNWIERNKLWIGAVGGIFGTVLIMK